MSIISVEGLCKRYGKNESLVTALDNVCMEIEQGELISVTGKSGGGKSTLLHMLGAVDKPDSGTIIVDNKKITRMSEHRLAIFRRRSIGFIFQFFNLIPILSVEENIVLSSVLDGKKVDKGFLEELLLKLDLKDRRHHLPSQLSGGQQQRVSIGRAVFNRPAVILADEPTGNLDTKNSNEVIALLKGFCRDYGQTMVLITHDLSIAAGSDRIFCMTDGVLSEVSDR